MARKSNNVKKAVTSNVIDGEIKNLQKILAIEIQRAADLLKENLELEAKLEKIKQRVDCWRRLYRNIKPEEKV